MCGIAGIIGGRHADSTKHALAAMTESLRHRGPDDGGEFIAERPRGIVSLGQRRLSIIDLSAQGHQPMANPETGDVIVYNGELYNYREIRDELSSRGIVFRGSSDTEVVLRAFQVYGRDCLDRFRGMFALALWDPSKSSVLLARDHLGIKPLYLRTGENGPSLFASEVRAILATGWVPFDIDRRALAGFLAFGSVQSPLTMIRSVHSLEPGSWVELGEDGGVIQRNRYWRFPRVAEERGTSSSDRVVGVGAALERAVARHLVSDVPIGVFLSGGLDSAAIAGYAQRATNGQIRSFTVGFSEQRDHDERALAAATADHLGIDHVVCEVGESTVLGWVEDALANADQPSMDGLNVYVVSRLVRENGIIVALSGQGGDEMFGGYPSFRDVPRIETWMRALRRFPRSLRARASRLAATGRSTAYALKLEDLAQSDDIVDVYFHRRRALSNTQIDAMGLAPGPLGLSRHFQTEDVARECVVDGDPVATVQRLETKYYLGNMLLRDGDVFSMASSLEVRVPFLDRDVVDRMLMTPGKALLPKGERPKHLLRAAASQFFPDRVRRAPKSGFVVPVHRWIAGPLRELTNQAVDNVVRSGLVSNVAVRDVVEEFHRAPETPIWTRVWTLVALGQWLSRQRSSEARGSS